MEQSHSTAKTQFIAVNGINYAYRSFGSEKGTPLVFLQHITGTMDNWDPYITNGLAAGRRVILFDNTGVASTDGETPDNIPAMARDAAAFISALGLNKVDLLAYSLGGLVGQVIVDVYPALVRKLVLVGTGPKGGPGIDQFRTYFMDAVQKPGYEVFLHIFFTASERSRAQGKATLERLAERPADKDAYLSEQTMTNQTKAVENWGKEQDPDFTLLKRIEQPVLIINGSDDVMFPPVNSFNMLRNIPYAQLSLYPDSAHGALYQYPELFVEQVRYFLDQDLN